MEAKTQRKRDEILAQMSQIQRLRQGTISEQYYGSGENRRGPYYVLQGYSDGKHWSKRVSADQIAQMRADIEAGAHFKDLCKAFAEITEQATIRDDQSCSKKNARKRNKSAIAKPKRS